jgi:general secretion pathway protein H
MRNNHKECATGEAGFTLIELLVGLGILAIAIAITVPSLNRSRENLALRAAAYELAASLRAARAAAQSSNTEKGMTIDQARHLYWAEGVVPPRALPASAEVLVPESERLGTTTSRIRFYADGGSSGARIVLKDEKTTAAVYVDWLNGDVRVHLRP